MSVQIMAERIRLRLGIVYDCCDNARRTDSEKVTIFSIQESTQVYVCMYMHIGLCTSAQFCMYKWTIQSVAMHVDIFYMYTSTNLYVCIYIFKSEYIGAIYTCIHVYICVCVHTHFHMCRKQSVRWLKDEVV